MPQRDDLTEVSTEHLLVFLGPQGAERAFAELVHRFMPLVYQTCRRQVNNDHAAEDAAQAVFLLLHQKQLSFPNEAALASWLYRTAVLTGKRHRRDRMRRRKHEENAGREQVAAGELGHLGAMPADGGWGPVEDMLDEALATLPDGMRQTLVMRYLHGMSEAETAAALRCPVGTVSSRVNKSIKKLRDFFARKGFGAVSVGLIAAGLGNLASAAVPGLPALVAQTQAVAAGTLAPSAAVGVIAAELGRGLALQTMASVLPWGVLGSVGVAAVTVLSLSLGGAAAPLADDRFVGYRGDGQGRFLTATPVLTQWDEATGAGVRWRVPLPNWGHGSPLVVDGRVFVICEPGQVAAERVLPFPRLLCHHAGDGRLLWERDLDHLGEDDHHRLLWLDLLKKQAEANRLLHAKLATTDATADAQAAAAGIRLPFAGTSGNPRTQLRYQDEGGRTQPMKFHELSGAEMLARRYGLALDTWTEHGLHIGVAFPTPASDGQRVVAATASGLVAAFALDGTPLWQHWDPGMNLSALTSDQQVASPVIVRDKVVLATGGRLRCFSLADGRLLWQRPMAYIIYMVGTPLRLELGGQDLLFTATGEVVRVADGELLAAGIGNQGSGASPVGDGGTRVFITNGSVGEGNAGRGARFAERGIAALQLTLAADGRLDVERLWHNDDSCADGDGRSPVFHQGRLYLGGDGTVLNADTGSVLRIPDLEAAERSHHAITLVGDHLLTLSDKGTSVLLDLDGEVRGRGQLLVAANEGAKRDQRILLVAGLAAQWPFTHSLPACAGDRIYIRSNDALYCLGNAP